MFKIKIMLAYMGVSVLKFIYFFIKLFKTQKKMTFISRQSNTASHDFCALEKRLKQQHPDYKIVVLAKRLDNPFEYIFHMFKQMYHVATSKVVILDSYCIVISVLKHKKTLKVIQIWHAIGSMKKFGHAMIGKPEGSSKEIARLMKMHNNYDIVLISSMNFVKDFEEGFKIDKSKVIEVPLPRVDLLLDDNYKNKVREELYEKHPQLKQKKNILYCSTFRKNAVRNTKHIDDLIDEIDFSKYNLLYKPHEMNKIKCCDNRVITDFKTTFEALFVADYVICDYSSIIYEIGLLHLPLYLYAYDWEEYKNKRELNVDLKKDSGLLFTDNPQTIIREIEKDNYDETKFQRFVQQNVKIPKEGCTNKIVKIISENL